MSGHPITVLKLWLIISLNTYQTQEVCKILINVFVVCHLTNIFSIYFSNKYKLLYFYFLAFYLGTARVIRSDGGTENVIIASLQRYFRSNHRDAMAGYKSFLPGKSTANQVINILLFGVQLADFFESAKLSS